jgi:ankyrin repeat protein
MFSPPSHKRTKSTLSLLRRSTGKPDDDGTSDSGSIGGGSYVSASGSGQPSTKPTQPSGGHAKSQSIAGINNSTVSIPRTGKMSAPAPEKTLSIEQSVRKFRTFEALRSGDTALISKSIREASESAGAGSLEDTTILHLAIQCAELPVVEYVLSDGAGSIDVNAKDRDGNTPLHVAAQQGRGQIVRLLLAQPGINDSVLNYQGKLPLDLARTPDIFQQLQLSRSLFVDAKIKEIQLLIANGDYKTLGEVLEEPRVKTVLDINGGEFASEITTVQSGGTLLHEAARRRNTRLIQVLLLHGADPFRRDRRGKLPQDVTKDETTRAMLKKSPAAVAAQRGIQEKAVLGNLSNQGPATNAGDILAGKESREMKGYLKKWTNYRKGYQLRWFVLEDGVLSYYKHQDDTGSACRGAINMKIAKLHMDPTEKQKFEIIGKSSVKYSLKANHEVEAKRWFWALNNSIQWTKDQAKEESKQKERVAELLRQAKAEQSERTSTSMTDLAPESVDGHRTSMQSTRTSVKQPSQRVAFKAASTSGSVGDDEEGTAYGGYEPSFRNDIERVTSAGTAPFGTPDDDDNDDDDYNEDASSREAPASKDAFIITAQSARLQLEMMSQVHAAVNNEQNQNPTATLSDPLLITAISTYGDSIRSLKSLLADMLKISKDRDKYWQRRLDHEAEMRQMWEDSMAQVAREQEVLEAKMGESELKRKRTKRVLREVIESTSRPQSIASINDLEFTDAVEEGDAEEEEAIEGLMLRRKSTARSPLRRKSILEDIKSISDSGSEDDEEFFDAVDAGEVELAPLPMKSPVKIELPEEEKGLILANGADLSIAFHGYEDGIRKRLKMDADDRPKISLWVSTPCCIG